MKGVILAGGTGSRLLPLTKVVNKHVLPVGQKPMLYYPIEKMVGVGIKEIMVVSGVEHVGSIIAMLGSGKEFGCEFTYRVQDEAGGIAQALGLAEKFVGSDSVLVLLGDNIFKDDLILFTGNYKRLQKERGARLALKPVHDPQRYGVATVKSDHIVDIEEKPEVPKTNLAVTGIYLYDSSVFDIIKTLKPSRRNELEITDVNRYYMENSSIGWDLLSGFWTDAGTFASLAEANQLVTDDAKLSDSVIK